MIAMELAQAEAEKQQRIDAEKRAQEVAEAY